MSPKRVLVWRGGDPHLISLLDAEAYEITAFDDAAEVFAYLARTPLKKRPRVLLMFEATPLAARLEFLTQLQALLPESFRRLNVLLVGAGNTRALRPLAGKDLPSADLPKRRRAPVRRRT